ncbi:hypothetical protein niasHS_015979 [Heterodera schachtii]|uniref:RYYR-CCHC domain-containing protein n=1 Tax=Heterodera schachtii TaxID=97005 RepID=A0ABD2HXT4_HETSC
MLLILLIEFPPPDAPQYRLTNRSRDGRKLYFRCSRCDTLIKKDGHQFGIRTKLIVEDGHIVSERFPQHHPLCVPKPLEEVLVQQVDRTSRREVKDGYLLPQDVLFCLVEICFGLHHRRQTLQRHHRRLRPCAQGAGLCRCGVDTTYWDLRVHISLQSEHTLKMDYLSLMEIRPDQIPAPAPLRDPTPAPADYNSNRANVRPNKIN